MRFERKIVLFIVLVAVLSGMALAADNPMDNGYLYAGGGVSWTQVDSFDDFSKPLSYDVTLLLSSSHEYSILGYNIGMILGINPSAKDEKPIVIPGSWANRTEVWFPSLMDGYFYLGGSLGYQQDFEGFEIGVGVLMKMRFYNGPYASLSKNYIPGYDVKSEAACSFGFGALVDYRVGTDSFSVGFGCLAGYLFPYYSLKPAQVNKDYEWSEGTYCFWLHPFIGIGFSY